MITIWYISGNIWVTGTRMTLEKYTL